MTSDRSHVRASAPLVYVGSEVRAAGYRLGGFRTLTPATADADAVERALRDAAVVVLEAAYAERLPRARVERWLAAGTPLVMIAPHDDGAASPLDPAERVRVQLGLEA